MSKKENKARARDYIEQVWNQHNLANFSDYIAKDVEHRGAQGFSGREEMKQRVSVILNAFPDFHQTLDDVIASGDKVVMRWTSSATHQGDFFDLPATGKRATWSGMSIVRLADGKIAELWVESDNMSMMQQLGAIPTPGQG